MHQEQSPRLFTFYDTTSRIWRSTDRLRRELTIRFVVSTDTEQLYNVLFVYVFVKFVKQRCIFAAEKSAKFCSFFRFIPWKIRKLSGRASTLPNTSRWWYDFEKNEIKVDNAKQENYSTSIEILKKNSSWHNAEGWWMWIFRFSACSFHTKIPDSFIYWSHIWGIVNAHRWEDLCNNRRCCH